MPHPRPSRQWKGETPRILVEAQLSVALGVDRNKERLHVVGQFTQIVHDLSDHLGQGCRADVGTVRETEKDQDVAEANLDT